MKPSEKKLHRLALAFLMSFIVWILITNFLMEISFLNFIIIQIIIGVGEVFTTFIKEKLGISLKKSEPINQEK